MVTGGRWRALLPQLGVPDPLLPAQELDSLAERRDTSATPLENGAARAGRGGWVGTHRARKVDAPQLDPEGPPNALRLG